MNEIHFMIGRFGSAAGLSGKSAWKSPMELAANLAAMLEGTPRGGFFYVTAGKNSVTYWVEPNGSVRFRSATQVA